MTGPALNSEDRMRRRMLLAAVAVLALPCASLSHAQSDAAYPAKPVKILVGANAGGGTDIIARMLADDVGAAAGIRPNEYLHRLRRIRGIRLRMRKTRARQREHGDSGEQHSTAHPILRVERGAGHRRAPSRMLPQTAITV